MKRWSLPLFIIVLGQSLGGCGLRPVSDDVTPSLAPQTPTAPVAGSGTAKVVNRMIEAVPIETFLVSSLRVPNKLSLRDLTVSFRSNAKGATFECRSGRQRDFVACPDGEAFTFQGMANGSSQSLDVRARSPLGEMDATPLSLAFVIDLEHGALPTADGDGKALRVPQSGAELIASRSLPVGAFFAVAVPNDAQTAVATYSTDKTYNGRLDFLRLMNQSKDPCTREYERAITVDGGAVYCEATPTAVQLLADYAEPLPRNHLDVVKFDAGQKPTERFMLAAFDATLDQGEGQMGVEANCRGSIAAGQTQAVLFNDFFRIPQKGLITWCQVRDPAGTYWWLGAFQYSSASGSTRLKGIYAASAGLGIFSGQDFAQRTADLLGKILVPVALAQ